MVGAEGISVRLSMFYSTLLLTGVNLLLRLVATSFQVYISGRIGATGVGLLQLVLSVAMLAETAGLPGSDCGDVPVRRGAWAEAPWHDSQDPIQLYDLQRDLWRGG